TNRDRAPKVAPQETAKLVQPRTCPCSDRLTVNRALYIESERIDGLVSVRGLFAQGFRDNRIEIPTQWSRRQRSIRKRRRNRTGGRRLPLENDPHCMG